MKNKTSECVAIGKEESRYWESKNNLNAWTRTIQDKSKKTNKEIKMRELKYGGARINIKRKIRIGLMQFRNLRGVWYMFSNNNFKFLNNVIYISTHFFIHTYFHKHFQIRIFNF